MEISSKDIPEFDAKKMEKKAKKLWKDLNEDKIEIKFITTPMGLLVMAAGITTLVCLAKCVGKMEKRASVKKQAKKLARDIGEKRGKKKGALSAPLFDFIFLYKLLYTDVYYKSSCQNSFRITEKEHPINQAKAVRPHGFHADGLLLCHHNFGNGIQNLVMTASAAGRAVRDFLNLFKGFQHVVKLINLMQRFFHIAVRNLLAVTNHFVFFHTYRLLSLSAIAYECILAQALSKCKRVRISSMKTRQTHSIGRIRPPCPFRRLPARAFLPVFSESHRLSQQAKR